MKNLSLSLLVFCLYTGVSAQYKKASFFEKEGRTYGLNTKLFSLGDGKGSPMGFSFTFGRDRDGKQWFTFGEFTYIPSYKFSLNTADRDNNPITVSGKSRSHIIYGLNLGYHLLKNKGEEQKLQPYLTAGMSFVINGGLKQVDNDNYDNKIIVADRNFSMGIGGGLGCLWNFAPRFALKVEGGYTQQANIEIESGGQLNTYYLFTKHTYTAAGIRFRITSE